GGTYIEILKKQLKALDYDYVFIDSRTGISDYSGIVNVQIPDVNVLVVAPTNQNFAGALRIAENIKNSPYVKDGNRKPIIMPILSRVDLSIENRSNDWISKFQEKFGLFIKEFCEITNTREREFLNSTILDYKRDLSFGENKLFKDKFEEINDKTLAKQYLVIAKYIQILNKEFSNESLLISNKEYLLNLIDKLEIAEVFTILDTTGSGSNNTLRNLKKEYILGNNRHDFYHRLKLYIEEFYTETQKNNLIIKDEEFNHNIRKLTWVDISQFSFVILGFNISFLTILSFLSYYVMDSLYATYITLTIYYILSILTFYFVDFGLERFFNKNFVFEKFGIFSLKMFFLVIFNFFMTFLWNFYNVYEIKYKNIIYSSYISLILILFFLYIYNLIINAIEQRRIKQNKESQSKIKWN
ncbi:MAG: hypothetical protein MUF43_08345, partial [Flavobacterium sp.]|nr:hypothetical protein [Flavobacterium sp.]